MTITECPRDAMQGIKDWIPTSTKISYLNKLLAVGFDYLDFGSFVSPKAIPQMADTALVLEGLDLSVTKTKLLAIIANIRGAEQACQHDQVSMLGYPFSVSETFQLRNVNKTIAQSWEDVAAIHDLALKHGKELQVYLSMGFGNPYGDPYSPELVAEIADKLYHQYGIKHIAPSDTIGTSATTGITALFSTLTTTLPEVRFSAHLHTLPQEAQAKVEAAWAGGCRHFDAALLGFGGCPMAADNLTGNLPTEQLFTWLKTNNEAPAFNNQAWYEALTAAEVIFAPFRH
jgi:hydroxymethylglutaryl-CoA lyase